VTCASGWVQYGGSCYLINPAFNSGGPFGSQYGTWDQCNAYCTASYSGATMLCVNNAAENEWMWTQYRSRYWIGYTDMLPYGGGKGTMKYGWVTGCSSTYTNWYGNNPDNDAYSEDYVLLWELVNGQWNDATSSIAARCGCQYKPADRSSCPSSVSSSGAVLISE